MISIIPNTNNSWTDLFDTYIRPSHTNSADKNRSRSYSNERVLNSQELNPHHQMQFSVIHRTVVLGARLQGILSAYSKTMNSPDFKRVDTGSSGVGQVKLTITFSFISWLKYFDIGLPFSAYSTVFYWFEQ